MGRSEGAQLAIRLLLLLTALFTSGMAGAGTPRIAIIIDDMGNGLAEGRRAVALPGPITYSFLPRTPHARRLADAAHAAGKEVMLHLPMEAKEGNRLGPGGLTSAMSEAQLEATLRADLASVPHVRGINNHMGSLLTTRSAAMQWLMGWLAVRGDLFFVDSRTTDASLAFQTAAANGVPALRRDIFLDHTVRPAVIAAQFDRLLLHARSHGHAIAIGHPHRETLDFLETALPQLRSQGILLVPVSQLVLERDNGRIPQWQASLSPSPKGAKNSKR